MNAEEAIAAVALISSLGIVADACELLNPDNVLDKFFNWNVTRHRFAWLAGEHSILGFLTQTRPLQVLIAVRAVAAVAFPFCLIAHVPYSALLPLFVLSVIFLVRLRLPYSFNGADQMQTLIWAALSGYALTGDEVGQFVVLGFIAAQAILSYVAAGWLKLATVTPFWRDGTAVGRVLQTDTFGMPKLAEKIPLKPFSAIVSWSTIVFETFGPVLIFFGPTATLVFISAAFVFHAAIGITMGLNRFLFAFPATFPALYWASVQIQNWIHL